MITLRKSQERGYADHGWLKSYHSFSFAGYYDEKHMGFGNLRVINDDYIAPGTGFGTHSHKDMEIITYLLHGGLAHKDSMGNARGIAPGEVQRMSAGTGVQHSEFSDVQDQTTHLLQIWIEPTLKGIAPGYEQKMFTPDDKRGKLQLIASPDGLHGSVTIHADAKIYAALLAGDEATALTLNPARKTYVHLIRGQLQANGLALSAGDAALLVSESQLTLNNGSDAEVLVFDLAA